MIRTESRAAQLDELLGIGIAAIDIPPAIRARAVARYQEVAAFLAAHSPGEGDIYTQGSFRLGTVVAPVAADGEYDMDLVYLRQVHRDSITKLELKGEVGRSLRAFADSGPEGDPELGEGKRCWTLDYPGEPFHMDALPAIPDPDVLEPAILLTDRELREWQPSNPIGYANWFRSEMLLEMTMLREAAAIAKSMDIDAVPEDEIKTTLQRTVQALKRHRDLHFGEDHDELAPASIIITTLAARAYIGGAGLFEVVSDITGRMADFVEVRNGVFWVANPVRPTENFADRWKARPRRAQAFFDWIERAHADFSAFGNDLGIDRVIEKMSLSLGESAAHAAGGQYGAERLARRNAGALGVSAAGTLGLTSRSQAAVPRHTFHGDGPPRRP
jgi:hypothetical protein